MELARREGCYTLILDRERVNLMCREFGNDSVRHLLMCRGRIHREKGDGIRLTLGTDI
jgi:hypothetical protein